MDGTVVPPQSFWKTSGQILWNLGLITTGSCICAIAINGILIPKGFVSGGVTGLALVVHYLLPQLAVSTLYLLFEHSPVRPGLEICRPPFLYLQHHRDPHLFRRRRVGPGGNSRSGLNSWPPFWPGSLWGWELASSSAPRVPPGERISFRSWSLTRFSVRLGNTVLAFNSAVLIMTAILFSLESALYTLIFIYVTSHFMDLVVTGLSQRKAVMIISRSQEEIVKSILGELDRGVTVIEGRGGYSGQPNNIVYTVIAFRELSRIKRLIQAIDPDAFVVVTDTTEVMGHRIGNQPHW